MLEPILCVEIHLFQKAPLDLETPDQLTIENYTNFTCSFNCNTTRIMEELTRLNNDS